MKGVEHKPSVQTQVYLDILKDDQWALVEHSFTKDYCRLQGLSPESSLLLTTQASALALPKLAKVMTHIKNQPSEGLSHLHHSELPCEIDLGSDFKYHDIFVCPVSKEMSVKDNNPMLLQCGHVISKNSLTKLVRAASTREGKFKCHTCPATMTMANVQEIKIN